MRTSYSRTLRIISAVTLTFFSWTFLSLWQIPAAIAAEKQKPDARTQTTDSSRRLQPARELRPEEKFETAVEAIREKAGKASEKEAKGEDDSAEIEAIKAKKTEIESLDLELKKEFAETENRLKAAKLPKEILARHAAFVEHYTSNANSLRKELDDIDSAKTTADRKAKIEKVRLHLEKTKPKKHVQKLDPENLPFKARKITKTREPRLDKKSFEKEFSPQRSQRSSRTAWNPPVSPFDKGGQKGDLIPAANEHQWQRIKQKPTLLAFNETASDIPFSYGTQPSATQLVFSDSAPIILAQAAIHPMPDDLAETPEVQFTPAIRAKAQELGGNPVKIYEFVRNSIEYAPVYGSIQGADMCLQSKICNDMDTASLLISLLRVSGIYAHYVYGTVEIPIEKAMNLVGGVTNPMMVGTILATNGIPATALFLGSTIKYERIEHVWVNAYIDYIPSRGAVQRQGNTWIPLDPSYKQYNYTQGIDVAAAVPFDAQSFANQILSTATTNTTDGSVTKVNSTLVQQAMQDYQTRVQSYIQQNYPNATVGDVIGKKEIIMQEFGILPESLPYKGVLFGSEFAQIPENLRETISFSIPDPIGASAGLSYTTGMPQIAGKKITLSFSPATAADQATIESYLPKPHADGTPIQLSELPSSFHAYLINLKPELRIDGQVVATGASAMMGSEQSFTMSLNEPGIGLSNIDNVVKAGEYFGIGVDTGRVGADRINVLKTKLKTTKAKLDARAYSGITKDDLMGDILSTVIACYFGELDVADEIAARTTNIIRYRAPSVGMFSFALNVNDTFGVPTNARPKGMVMDVDRIMQAVFGKDGSMDKVKQYMLSSGSNSSALEHDVPEQLFSTPTNDVQGVSAVTALRLANDQGIPIYVVDQSNINSIFPLLQLNEDVKTDIQNAVNAGKMVTVQQSNITYNGWTGCGYIIIDPNTGAGAYMISNGLNGYCFWYYFWTVMWILAIIALTIALGMLVGAFAPVIAAATVAFDDAVTLFIAEIGEWFALQYSNLSQKYLFVSFKLADLFQKTKWSAALYDASVFYAQNSPPPWPVPTDKTGVVYYLMTYVCFLYLKYTNKSEYLTNYWRFAENADIIFLRFYNEHIMRMSDQPSLISEKELYCYA